MASTPAAPLTGDSEPEFSYFRWFNMLCIWVLLSFESNVCWNIHLIIERPFALYIILQIRLHLLLGPLPELLPKSRATL
jgi:hypothetical protein